MAALRTGVLIGHNSVPGVGRVGAIDGATVRVDYFEAVAEHGGQALTPRCLVFNRRTLWLGGLISEAYEAGKSLRS